MYHLIKDDPRRSCPIRIIHRQIGNILPDPSRENEAVLSGLRLTSPIPIVPLCSSPGPLLSHHRKSLSGRYNKVVLPEVCVIPSRTVASEIS